MNNELMIEAKELLNKLAAPEFDRDSRILRKEIVLLHKLEYPKYQLKADEVIPFLNRKLAACDMPQELHHDSKEEGR